MKKVLLVIIFCFLSSFTAWSKPTVRQLKIIYKVAKSHNLDSAHLIKIAALESNFKEEAINYNSNGSVDYGLFQINTIHWSTTCKDLDIFTLEGNAQCAARLVFTLKYKHSAKDPCWLARYHSSTPSKKELYCQKLGSL